MRIKEGFVTYQQGDEQIMVATGSAKFSGLVRSNGTAGFIVDCLKQDTTEEKIVDAILEQYDAPRDVVERDVKNILDKLRSIGALEE